MRVVSLDVIGGLAQTRVIIFRRKVANQSLRSVGEGTPHHFVAVTFALATVGSLTISAK
jgi:hypothetical protein